MNIVALLFVVIPSILLIVPPLLIAANDRIVYTSAGVVLGAFTGVVRFALQVAIIYGLYRLMFKGTFSKRTHMVLLVAAVVGLVLPYLLLVAFADVDNGVLGVVLLTSFQLPFLALAIFSAVGIRRAAK